MIDPTPNTARRLSAWVERAQAASAWRDGDALDPVLEALALAVALEVTGDLPLVEKALRDKVVSVGRRALLRAGRPSDDDDEAEAARIALSLARDGLRALAGGAPAPERDAPAPSARDLARLVEGRAEPFEAASIARRARRSARARRELSWALGGSVATAREAVRLAAADGEPLRDPARGVPLAVVSDPDSGAPIAELVAFPDGAVAVYASADAPVRLEGAAWRTRSMSPGYWLGERIDGAEGSAAGALEGGTVLVDGRAFPLGADAARATERGEHEE